MVGGYSGWLMGWKERYLDRKDGEWREKNGLELLSKFCELP